MKLLLPLLVSASTLAGATREIHVGEMVEITLHAVGRYANPYTNVEVWVDLHGPQFDRRCYGFWDGDDVFRVRILAPRQGSWTWQSGSNQKDTGLNHQKGRFTTVQWSETKKTSIPTPPDF